MATQYKKDVRPTQTSPAGPAGSEYARVDAIEGSRPIIENAMPRFRVSFHPILGYRLMLTKDLDQAKVAAQFLLVPEFCYPQSIPILLL